MNGLFRIISVLLFFFNSPLFAQSQDQPLIFDLAQSGTMELNKLKYYTGGSQNYYDPGFDDSSRKTAELPDFALEERGIQWFRAAITFVGEPEDTCRVFTQFSNL